MGAIPSVDASATTRLSCKESLMRHPPPSVLLAVACDVDPVAGSTPSAVTAEGAAPARTVEYSVTGQWDAGLRAAVRNTDHVAALSSWSPTLDFVDGRPVTRGWNAWGPQSGASVTAANESSDGSLGTGTSTGVRVGVDVSAGFLATKAGATRYRRRSRSTAQPLTPTPTPSSRPHARTRPPRPRRPAGPPARRAISPPPGAWTTVLPAARSAAGTPSPPPCGPKCRWWPGTTVRTAARTVSSTAS